MAAGQPTVQSNLPTWIDSSRVNSTKFSLIARLDAENTNSWGDSPITPGSVEKNMSSAALWAAEAFKSSERPRVTDGRDWMKDDEGLFFLV